MHSDISLTLWNWIKFSCSEYIRSTAMACKRPVLLLLMCVMIKSCLTFELEGSQTSYAKFPKWNPCQNGSISLEFKTSRQKGLILYSDDGGRFDFFEIKLVAGAVRLRIDLGGGASMINIGENLNDNEWHKIEMQRNGRYTTLIVDNLERRQTSQGDDYGFGNYSENSYIFIGGVPVAYSAKLSLLALPSVMFEPRFRGSIRNLLYADCGGPTERAEMLDNTGVRTNSLDECERENRCQNGGTCISTDTGSFCDCSGTDYEGVHCESGWCNLLFTSQQKCHYCDEIFIIGCTRSCHNDNIPM